jgi:hypothetical protein
MADVKPATPSLATKLATEEGPSSICVAPDGVLSIHDSPTAVLELVDVMRRCRDPGRRKFCLGLATVVAQECYSHTYGAWMPMWLGPDHPIVETPFIPFAICDFASAAIERLAILTAAAGLKCGDPTARELAAGAIGLGGALPEMAAVTEMLADLRTLTAAMNSPVPAHYLLGAVRRKIRAERVQPAQKRTDELESDLAEALCGTVGIDVQEYLDHLRAAGKRKDLEIARTMEAWLAGATKQELGDAQYQRLLYHLKQPRARAIATRARRMFVRGPGIGVMAPSTWYYTHGMSKASAWHRLNAPLLR